VTVNPVLHIAMHEIVANQLWANDPPEMWETAARLLAAGYERHEVLHMLASVVSDELFEALRRPVVSEEVHAVVGVDDLGPGGDGGHGATWKSNTDQQMSFRNR
jgi:hypothetical protein